MFDMKAYLKIYNFNRREESKKYWKTWYSLNKQKHITYAVEWNRKNPIKRKALTVLRRTGGHLSVKTIQKVYEDNIKQYSTLTCYLCLEPILFGQDHLEHKIPICRGGTNKKSNLAVSCKKCNFSKGRKTVEEFIICKQAPLSQNEK